MQEADRRLKEEEKKLLDLKSQLGEEMSDGEVRDSSWLARRNLETATSARQAALETWRVVKKQFEAGANCNVQQVAQASGQYHFFDAMVIDAMVIDAHNKFKAEHRDVPKPQTDANMN